MCELINANQQKCIIVLQSPHCPSYAASYSRWSSESRNMACLTLSTSMVPWDSRRSLLGWSMEDSSCKPAFSTSAGDVHGESSIDVIGESESSTSYIASSSTTSYSPSSSSASSSSSSSHSFYSSFVSCCLSSFSCSSTWSGSSPTRASSWSR